MTPTRKPVRKTQKSDANNYNINDLHSDDSTDDEDAPRKKMPSWAQGMCHKGTMMLQAYYYKGCIAQFQNTSFGLDLTAILDLSCRT